MDERNAYVHRNSLSQEPTVHIRIMICNVYKPIVPYIHTYMHSYTNILTTTRAYYT